MPWKALLFIILLSPASNHSSAQVFDSSFVIPRSALRNTSFSAFFLADSFSKAGDSVLASAYLVRMDPYYLIYLYPAITPTSLDTFFSDYKVTVAAKEAFRRKFEAIYNTPRTETYELFKEMQREDQEVRNKLGYVKDSFTNALFEGKMRHADSIHFDYLYKYVQKYGWPKLADGGLYAELLALHNMDHMKYYLPYMKKAVLAGQSNVNMYNTVLNRAMKPDWLELAKKFKNKSVFDVSYILKTDTPTKAQMDLMKKAVKEHNPIKYICFLYESDNEKDFDRFKKGGWDASNYWIAWDLMVDLEHYQESLDQADDNNIPYQFAYSQSSIKRKKLTLYLLY